MDEVREVHGLAFPEDPWVGDDHEYWIVRDDIGQPVGFCSAIFFPDIQVAYLSRAAVIREARGHGLQRRMIIARVNWARKLGARLLVTYTTQKNYASMVNLTKAGFLFYKPIKHREWHDYHVFTMPMQLLDSNQGTALTERSLEKIG